MTTRNAKPTQEPAPADTQEYLPPPSGAPSGVPADVLTALALRPDGQQLSSPLDLDAMLDMEVAGWRPEPGDKLVGHVVNVEIAGEGSQFGAYPMLTIRRDDGGELVNVHAFHTVLRHELGKREVGMGDRIGIKYLGVKTPDAGLPYEDYRVVVQPQLRATVAKDWSAR